MKRWTMLKQKLAFITFLIVVNRCAFVFIRLRELLKLSLKLLPEILWTFVPKNDLAWRL